MCVGGGGGEEKIKFYQKIGVIIFIFIELFCKYSRKFTKYFEENNKEIRLNPIKSIRMIWGSLGKNFKGILRNVKILNEIFEELGKIFEKQSKKMSGKRYEIVRKFYGTFLIKIW